MSFKIVAKTANAAGFEEALKRIDAHLVSARFQTEDDVISSARDADAVIVGPVDPYSRRVIKALEKCKIISRVGIGWDNIDLEAATEQGIPVAYVPDASIEEVSDHAMALLLCFARGLVPISQAVREGGWQLGRNDILELRKPLARLDKQTLGLVGLGNIGGAVCRKAKAFGMKVITYDPYVSRAVIERIGIEQVSFSRLLAESDYISLHAPLTKQTRHLFGPEQFTKMKSTAYIVNTARGGLIDEEALVVALSKGHIAGAGLDVTDPEPPKPDNPLLKMKNVMITAHTAFYSPVSMSELSRRAMEAVVALLSRQWPRYLANPEVKERDNCWLNR